MKALVLLLAVTALGCTTPHRRYQSPKLFEQQAEEETEEMSFLTQDEDTIGLIKGCGKVKIKHREKCLIENEDTIRARLHIRYRMADKEDVQTYHSAYVGIEVGKNFENLYKNNRDIPKDVYLKIMSLNFYESLCRQSQWRRLAGARYSAHVGAVNSYNNAATARDLANAQAWSNVGNSINQANQKNQLQRIEDNQKQMQWQQKYDKYERDGGIIPSR